MPGPAPSANASNQLVNFGTTPQVAIAAVRSNGPGWVVVFDDAGGGTPGTMHGMTLVGDGLTTNVSVTLATAVTDGQVLVVVLYADAGTLGVFDGADMPQMAHGTPVTTSFIVSLPVLMAGDQSVSLTTLVTITTIRSFGDGWVTLHPDNTGSPDYGTTLGFAQVSAGTTNNLTIELDTPLTDGEKVHAALRIDQGIIGTLEGGDTVVQDNAMADVTKLITATVPANTADIRLTFGSNGSSDFQLESVIPTILADTVVGNPATDLGSPGGNDVTITLTTGTRYEVVNTVSGSHIFQFIDQTSGQSAGSDMVLLSQGGTTGSLEGDGTINWEEVDSQTMRFTVGGGFTSTPVKGYRCGVHPTMMRGDVTIN